MSLLNGVRPSIRHAPPGRPNSEAERAIEIAALAGLELFDWQAEALRDAMASGVGGRWAAREVGLVVGRQNGKGSILEARQVWGLIAGERLQVHSAHQFKTCYEHFRRVKDLIEGCPLLADQVAIIRTAAGDQAIEFRNGARLRFVARKGGSGRGFTASTVYLDEAFELDDETVGALMPTMMAMPTAQVWYVSSAPHATSEALHRVRERGARGDDPRLLYLEWGNDADADPIDRMAWERANPSIGVLIDPDEIAAAQRGMSPAMFAREHLGIPEMPDMGHVAPIPLERWGQLIDGDSLPTDDTLRLALDVPPDRTSASFAIAGKRADNIYHVSVRHTVPPHEMGRLVEIAKQLTEGHNVSLIIAPNSPALAWSSEMIAAGVPLDPLTPAEYAQACGLMMSKVAEGSIRHRGIPEMINAVGGLAVRKSGDVETWSRRSSTANISPFVAATSALVRVAATSGEAYAGSFSSLDDYLEEA